MIRKRIITLGLALGLVVNQIILYQVRTIAAEDYNVPQFLLNDMQKNMGINPTINNQRGITQKPQFNTSTQEISIGTHVYELPKLKGINNYNKYEQSSSYNPNRPEWRDFAPYGLADVVINEKIAKSKRRDAKTKTYWYYRRLEFEKDLAQCDRLQDVNKNLCYQKVSNRQLNLNNQRAQEEEQAAIREMQLRQMFGQIAQQINANNYAAAQADREYQLRKQEMMMKYHVGPPNVTNYFNTQPTTYRFYDRYGRPQGYVQQSNW